MSNNETVEVQAPSKIQKFIKNHYTSIVFTSGVITAAAVCMIGCKFFGTEVKEGAQALAEAADQLTNN